MNNDGSAYNETVRSLHSSTGNLLNDERVLITGAGGMLGNAVYPYFASRYKTATATDKDVNESWLTPLDVRDKGALRRAFEHLRPTLVLHLAACTDLEFCEVHADVAQATNAEATREVAILCERLGATMVYISTAGVFDGTKQDLYTEQDRANPIMVYGSTKYEGELLAHGYCSRAFVVRAGWMVGGGARKDHKFVHHILGQIVSGAKKIHAVNDRFGTPTYTHDFALNLFKLLDTKKYGTYHMVCEGAGTRYDVARAILEIGKRDDIELVSVDSSHFAGNYFAPRPVSEMMTNANLRALGINVMRPWKDALKDYVLREFPHALAGAQAPGSERRLRHERRKETLAWTGPERRRTGERRTARAAGRAGARRKDEEIA
jgi:dTDP-4-dehydrorhamnose reductase